MCRRQGRNTFAEDATRTPGVGAEELAESKDEGEWTTAERKIGQNATVAAVGAIREVAADGARGGSGTGSQRNDDEIKGNDQIGR